MASERPTKILFSKSDLSHEQIEKMSDKKAWELIYSIRTVRVRDNRLQVCFTGFGISRKQELANIARANNFKVVASVTKKLDFLCGGTNAGPKKREKAESQGVQFLDEKQFLYMVETGETPR